MRPLLRLRSGLTLGLALALALLPAASSSADDMAQRLKVVYLYNFTVLR